MKFPTGKDTLNMGDTIFYFQKIKLLYRNSKILSFLLYRNSKTGWFYRYTAGFENPACMNSPVNKKFS